MSKIFELKKWLPLDEAAEYLSIILNEKVKTHDLYRLALDGHLKLSINLVNHAYVKKGQIVSFKEAKKGLFSEEELKKLFPDDDWQHSKEIIWGIHLTGYKDNNQFLELEDEVRSLSGVYDLLMVGNEKLDIEYLYQQSTSGIEVTLTCIEGSYLIDTENNQIAYELQDTLDSGDYFPAPSLPNNATLVIRTNEIKEFLTRLNPKDREEKADSTRKIKNLLQTLTAIAIDQYGFVPTDAKSPIPKEISDNLSHQGLNLDPKTIRVWLKEGYEILTQKSHKN